MPTKLNNHSKILNPIISGGCGAVDSFSLEQLGFHDFLWDGY
jgi:hypothetical protein